MTPNSGCHQIQEGTRFGVIAGVDQHVAARRQPKDVVFRKLLYVAFHHDKGVVFFEAVGGQSDFGLAQVPFPEEDLVVKVGKANPGLIHQPDSTNASGQEIKGSGRRQATSPGNEYLGGFQAFLNVPSPPIQGHLAGVARHFGRT